MVFTCSVEKIRSKVNVCVDVSWISLMVIKEDERRRSIVEGWSDEGSSGTESESDSVPSERSGGRLFEEDLHSISGDSPIEKQVYGDCDVSNARGAPHPINQARDCNVSGEGFLQNRKATFSSEKEVFCSEATKWIKCCYTIEDNYASRSVVLRSVLSPLNNNL